jgi:LacI family transcriptional regulator
MMVTMKDIALKAGVSQCTVSRVLSGKQSGKVKEETRLRVLTVAQELNYRPNLMAKGLASNRSWLIGLIISSLKNPLMSSMIDGIHFAAKEFGYNILSCATDMV